MQCVCADGLRAPGDGHLPTGCNNLGMHRACAVKGRRGEGDEGYAGDGVFGVQIPPPRRTGVMLAVDMPHYVPRNCAKRIIVQLLRSIARAVNTTVWQKLVDSDLLKFLCKIF